MLFKKQKEIIGIDLGSNALKLVQLKGSKGSWQLVNVGAMALPPEAIVDKSLMDSTSIAETLGNLVQGLGVKVKEVASSVSGSSVIIRKIYLPAMTVEELEDQIQWEAEQYIPFDINDVNIDFQILETSLEDVTKMSVLLVASKKDIVNDYVAVFSEAGLKLEVVDVDAFAVQNAYELNYDLVIDEVVALVNIGASITNLNIVKNGDSLFTRDIQLGGNLYNEEIQKQLGLSSEEAEQAKVTGDYPDKERLQNIVSRVNETLALEIKRSIDFYVSTASDEKVHKIYLSGGTAKTSSLIEAVNQRLGIEVELLNPFNKLKYNDKDFDPEYLREIGPLATVAVGLATRRLGDK